MTNDRPFYDWSITMFTGIKLFIFITRDPGFITVNPRYLTGNSGLSPEIPDLSPDNLRVIAM